MRLLHRTGGPSPTTSYDTNLLTDEQAPFGRLAGPMLDHAVLLAASLQFSTQAGFPGALYRRAIHFLLAGGFEPCGLVKAIWSA